MPHTLRAGAPMVPRRQRAREPSSGAGRYVAAAAALAIAAWFAAPYHNLHRLRAAVAHADAEELERLVDWPSIRGNMREILAAQMLHQAQKGKGNRPALTGLGMSLALAAAGPMLDSVLSPIGVAEALRAQGSGPKNALNDPAKWSNFIHWAAPSGPTSFYARVGQDKDRERQITLILEFKDWGWKLTRVIVPPALM